MSPEASALVGVRWEVLRTSTLGPALENKLFGKSGFTNLDLECLKQIKQILLSDPPFLAVASGQFPAGVVAGQAVKRGLRRTVFKTVELWIAGAKEGMSLARLSDQLVLIGEKEVLEAAIERSQAEGLRDYSHLLPRAALLGQQNLWVVYNGMPIPLAEEFTPLEQDANDPAKLFPPAPPPSPKPIQPPVPTISVNGVATPALAATPARPPAPAAPVTPAVTAGSVTQAPPKPAVPEVAAAKPAPAPARKTIRIVGLEEGTREVDFPPVR